MTEERQGWQYAEKGEKVSVYLSKHVLSQLQARSRALNRSVSWLINNALKRGLGMVEDDASDDSNT